MATIDELANAKLAGFQNISADLFDQKVGIVDQTAPQKELQTEWKAYNLTPSAISDGDTLYINGEGQRLAGFNAFEIAHPQKAFETDPDQRRRDANRLAYQRTLLAREQGKNYWDITEQDIYDRGKADRQALIDALPSDEQGNLTLEYRQIGLDQYGRPLTEIRNPLTGEILHNQHIPKFDPNPTFERNSNLAADLISSVAAGFIGVAEFTVDSLIGAPAEAIVSLGSGKTQEILDKERLGIALTEEEELYKRNIDFLTQARALEDIQEKRKAVRDFFEAAADAVKTENAAKQQYLLQESLGESWDNDEFLSSFLFDLAENPVGTLSYIAESLPFMLGAAAKATRLPFAISFTGENYREGIDLYEKTYKDTPDAAEKGLILLGSAFIAAMNSAASRFVTGEAIAANMGEKLMRTATAQYLQKAATNMGLRLTGPEANQLSAFLLKAGATTAQKVGTITSRGAVEFAQEGSEGLILDAAVNRSLDFDSDTLRDASINGAIGFGSGAGIGGSAVALETIRGLGGQIAESTDRFVSQPRPVQDDTATKSFDPNRNLTTQVMAAGNITPEFISPPEDIESYDPIKFAAALATDDSWYNYDSFESVVAARVHLHNAYSVMLKALEGGGLGIQDTNGFRDQALAIFKKLEELNTFQVERTENEISQLTPEQRNAVVPSIVARTFGSEGTFQPGSIENIDALLEAYKDPEVRQKFSQEEDGFIQAIAAAARTMAERLQIVEGRAGQTRQDVLDGNREFVGSDGQTRRVYGGSDYLNKLLSHAAVGNQTGFDETLASLDYFIESQQSKLPEGHPSRPEGIPNHPKIRANQNLSRIVSEEIAYLQSIRAHALAVSQGIAQGIPASISTKLETAIQPEVDPLTKTASEADPSQPITPVTPADQTGEQVDQEQASRDEQQGEGPGASEESLFPGREEEEIETETEGRGTTPDGRTPQTDNVKNPNLTGPQPKRQFRFKLDPGTFITRLRQDFVNAISNLAEVISTKFFLQVPTWKSFDNLKAAIQQEYPEVSDQTIRQVWNRFERFQNLSKNALKLKYTGEDPTVLEEADLAKNPILDLLKANPNTGSVALPRRIMAAISVSTASWLKEAGRRTIAPPLSLIGDMVGLREELVQAKHIQLFHENGLYYNVVADQLGQKIYSTLGIKERPTASRGAKERLVQSLGSYAIQLMVAQGELELTSMSKYELDKLMGKLPQNLSAKDRKDLEAIEIWFVKAKVDEDLQFSEQVQEDTNIYEKTPGLDDIIFGIESAESGPMESPTTVVQKTKENNIDEVATEQQKFIKEYQKTSYRMTDAAHILSTLGESFLETLLGKVDSKTAHVDRDLELEGKNTQIAMSIRNFLRMFQPKDEDGFELGDSDFYFQWRPTVSRRMVLKSNTFNPQSDTLHRFSVYMPQDDNEVNPADPVERLLYQFSFNIAMDLADEKVTPEQHEEAFNNFLRTNQDKLAQLREAVRTNNAEQIRKLSLELMGDSPSPHKFMGLMELTKFLDAQENGTTFQNHLLIETDGLTNGIAIGIHQLLHAIPESTRDEWLARVGVFTPAIKDATSVADRKAAGKFDSYQTLAAALLKRLENPALRNLLKAQKFDDEGAVSSELRELFKYPLMIFGYGAGIRSITNAFADNIIDMIRSQLEDPKYGTDAERIAQVNDIIKEFNKTKGFNIPLLDRINPARETSLRSIESQLRKVIIKNIGEDLEALLTDALGDFADTRTLLNQAFQLQFAAFDKKFNEALAQIRKKKSATQPITKADVAQAVRQARSFLPSFQGAMNLDSRQERPTVIKYGTDYNNDLEQTLVQIKYEEALEATGKASTVTRANLKVFQDPGIAGLINIIHSLDSTIQMRAIQELGYKILNVHDAGITSLKRSREYAEAYNKHFIEVMSNYNILEDVRNMLTTLDPNDSSLDQAMKDISFGEIKSFADFLQQLESEISKNKAARDQLYNNDLKVQQMVHPSGDQHTRPKGAPTNPVTFTERNAADVLGENNDITSGTRLPPETETSASTQTSETDTSGKSVQDGIILPESTRPEYDQLPGPTGTPTNTYAGVGSRETPSAIQAIMVRVAEVLSRKGKTLNTGVDFQGNPVRGADAAFTEGVNNVDGNGLAFDPRHASDRTKTIAKEIHPDPEALSSGALALQARSTYQIFGENLDTPVDFVLAWTPDGVETHADRKRSTGGTGQAISLADLKGIPVINMQNVDWLERLTELVDLTEEELNYINTLDTDGPNRPFRDLGDSILQRLERYPRHIARWVTKVVQNPDLPVLGRMYSRGERQGELQLHPMIGDAPMAELANKSWFQGMTRSEILTWIISHEMGHLIDERGGSPTLASQSFNNINWDKLRTWWENLDTRDSFNAEMSRALSMFFAHDAAYKPSELSDVKLKRELFAQMHALWRKVGSTEMRRVQGLTKLVDFLEKVYADPSSNNGSQTVPENSPQTPDGQGQENTQDDSGDETGSEGVSDKFSSRPEINRDLPEGAPEDGYQMSNGFNSNRDQTIAIWNIVDWFKNGSTKDRSYKSETFFTLHGRGGTGKTTIIDEAIRQIAPKASLYIAPTHKASSVLRKATGKTVSTLASATFVRKVYDRRLREKVFRVDGQSFNEGLETWSENGGKYDNDTDNVLGKDLIIIDESSMISQKQLNDLQQVLEENRNNGIETKVIFMGDRAQLPPINDPRDTSVEPTEDSPAFDFIGAELLIPMRQDKDSPILDIANRVADVALIPAANNNVRQVIKKEDRVTKLDKNNKGIIYTKDNDALWANWREEFLADPDNVRMIAFNNAQNTNRPQSVYHLNNRARKELYGDNLPQFVENELLVSTEPFTVSAPGGVEIRIQSNTDLNVVSVENEVRERSYVTVGNKRVDLEKPLPYRQVTLKLPEIDGKNPTEVTVPILTEEGQADLLNQYYALRKKGEFLASENLKETFFQSQYGYALTSHLAQGSTYNRTYVFEDNILNHGSPEFNRQRNQALYVAMSRPRNTLVMVSRANPEYDFSENSLGSEPGVNPEDFTETMGENLTSDNLRDVFRNLLQDPSSRISASFRKHLETLLETVISRGIEPMNDLLLKLKDGEANLGRLDGWNIHMTKTNRPRTFTQHSAEEVFVHELIHVISREIIEGPASDPVFRRKLRRLFSQAKKHITYKDFMRLDDDGNPITLTNLDEEIEYAKKYYDYVFNQGSSKDSLGNDVDNSYHEFFAYALTNERLFMALSRIPTRDSSVEPGQNLGERIIAYFQDLIAWLGDLLINRTSSQNIQSEVMKLAHSIGSVESSNMMNMLNFADRSVDTGLGVLGNSTTFMFNRMARAIKAIGIGNARKGSLFNIPDKILGTAANYVIYRTTTDNQTRTVVQNEIGSVMDKFYNPDSWVGEILGTVSTKTTKFSDWHRLLRQSKRLIDQIRKSVSSAVNQDLNDSFQTTLTEYENHSLTRALLQTDLSAITSKTMNQIRRLFSDSKYLDDEIKALRRKVLQQVAPRDRAQLNNQITGMATFMIYGETRTYNQHLNAHSLAREYNKPDLEAQLDELISMLAIQKLDNNVRETASAVIEREFTENSTENGILRVLQYHRGFKNGSRERLFNGNPMLMQKGYIAEIYSPSIDVQIAPLSDERAMKAKGYVLVEELVDDDTAPLGGNSGLYIAKNNPHIQRLKTIVSIQDQQTKGTDLAQASRVAGNPYSQIQDRQQILITAEEYKRRARQGKLSNVKRLIPVRNEAGVIVNYRYIMSERLRDTHLKKNYDLGNVLGAMHGSIESKVNSKAINRQVVDMLKDDYDRNYQKEPERFITMDSSRDNEFQETFRLLPKDMRRYIERTFGTNNGLPVRRELVNLVFGYRKASLSNLKWFKDNRVGHLIKIIEDGWQTLIAQEKVNIVVKSIEVMIDNIISNTVLLRILGVPIRDIIKDTKEATVAMNDYQKDFEKFIQLNRKLRADPSLRNNQTFMAELSRRRNDLNQSPVKTFIDEGVFTSITEDLDLDAYGNKEKFTEWFSDTVGKRTPGFIKDAARYAWLTEDTQAFKFLLKTTQYSDFTARYVQWKHLQRTQPNLTEQQLINEVMDTFINYEYPDNKYLQYMNDMGLFMFTKFFLRIQKVIFKTFDQQTANSMASIILQQNLGDVADPGDSSVLLRGIIPQLRTDVSEHIQQAITPYGLAHLF